MSRSRNVPDEQLTLTGAPSAPHLERARADAAAIIQILATQPVEQLQLRLHQFEVDAWLLAAVVEQSRRQALRDRAARAASSRNREVRDWVVDQWMRRNMTRHVGSLRKAVFARQMVKEINHRFGVTIKPETIARDWLKPVHTDRWDPK